VPGIGILPVIHRHVVNSLQEIRRIIRKSEEFPFQHVFFKSLAKNKEETVNLFVKKFDLKRLLPQSWLSSKLNTLYNKVCEIASFYCIFLMLILFVAFKMDA